MPAEQEYLPFEDAPQRWLVATYRPTAPFSLRMSTATSSGGKTLFVPTPYAAKLALVDAAIRAGTVDDGRRLFDVVKARAVRLRPPEHLVVNNTFIKVMRQREMPKNKMGADELRMAQEDLRRRPYQDTIAYREFCCFTGDLEVGVDATGLESDSAETLMRILAHVNYFGKRGSFMQFLDARWESSLSGGFSIPVDAWQERGGGRWGTIQPLDDLGETGSRDLFDRVSTFSNKSVELGKHRRLVYTLIPYELVSSSRAYSLYRRTV